LGTLSQSQVEKACRLLRATEDEEEEEVKGKKKWDQGTVDTVQGTFGIVQRTFGIIQGMFGIVQGIYHRSVRSEAFLPLLKPAYKNALADDSGPDLLCNLLEKW
jgi:hypothetical protein